MPFRMPPVAEMPLVFQKAEPCAHEVGETAAHHDVDVGRSRVGCELDLLHHADLHAAIVDRRLHADALRPLGAQDEPQPRDVDADRRVVEAVELGKALFAVAGPHLDLRTAQHGIEPGHLAKTDLRPHDPEHRAFGRDGRGRLMQARLHHGPAPILRELDADHFADLHAAVVDRGLAHAQAACVVEADQDLRSDRTHVLPDQVGGHGERDHGNHPYQTEQAPAADASAR